LQPTTQKKNEAHNSIRIYIAPQRTSTPVKVEIIEEVYEDED